MINGACQTFGFLDLDRQWNAPLFLLDFGLEQRKNETYDFQNNNRGSYSGFLIQYTLDGLGMFESEGQTTILSPGDAFFITFPDRSRYYLAENNSWKYFYIHFDGEMGQYFFQRIQAMTGKTFTIPNTSQAILLFLEEFQAVKSGKKYGRYDSGIFLYQFLTILMRELETPIKSVKNACVEDAAKWMQTNYKYQMGLSQMCRELDVSLPHLTRQFHLQTGLSPIKYLTSLRLEHALSLLLNTSMGLEAIATECGYSNSNYFSKVFRKNMGVSPAQYRDRHNGLQKPL
ncbi:MAG: AraC family transcriptional regulator [Paenibacillaceae bacterium]|nr:AraC family transcriptional regulator [Paenibacillaceae bacterium]